jgi:hypothetical protein
MVYSGPLQRRRGRLIFSEKAGRLFERRMPVKREEDGNSR